FGPVKDYLYEATRRARERLAVSNIYNCLHTGYGDELLFGQFCMIMTRSNRRFHGILPPVGQYWLAQSQYGMRVDTCYRRVWMPTEEIVARWVVKANGRDMDWSKVSTAVKRAWDKGSYDDMVEVFNAIEPRVARDP